VGSLHYIWPKSRLEAPKTHYGGIFCPTSPQHNHHDSSSSHSSGEVIFARSPSNYAYAAWRSVVHCSAIHWVHSACSAECSLLGSNPYLRSCITFICVSFPSMLTVMRKASSIQGWTCALSTASFWRTTSTFSFNSFAYCNLMRHWVRTTVCIIPRTLSYCIWSSHASVSNRCIVRSSCKVVRTPKDSSNNVV